MDSGGGGGGGDEKGDRRAFNFLNITFYLFVANFDI